MRNNYLEIEVKIPVSNHTDLKLRLNDAGAILSRPRTFECNFRFDTPSGDLLSESKVLRLRKDTQSYLTFKGPKKEGGGLQVRKEIEFTVSEFDSAHLFLEALGFEICLIYEKYRTNYVVGNITISLDEMPFGNFIEIEGPDEDTIRRMVTMLGLSWKYCINKSYSEIFEDLRQSLGFTFRDLTFENFSNIKIPVSKLPYNITSHGETS